MTVSLRTAEWILVTSYDSYGQAQSSVERLVSVSDTSIGFWLPDDTGARDRFVTDGVVSVRECDKRGRPVETEPVLEGRVRVLSEGSLFDEVRKAIHEKYALEAGCAGLVDKTKELFRSKTPECVVLINVIG